MITVAGAVDHDVLVALVTRALARAGWDPEEFGAPVERRSGTASLLTQGQAVSVVNRPLEQANILIGMPGLVAADNRRVTMSVLNSIFGGGMSSRLFQEVREKRGLAYSVYSFAPGYSDAGMFGMYAGCTPAKAGQVAELMLSELHRLADDGVTPDEMRRAAGQLSGASALALEDSDTRMSRLGRSELTLGEFAELDEALRRMAAVTADDVQALATELASGELSIAAVGALDDDAFASVIDASSSRRTVPSALGHTATADAAPMRP